MNFNCENLMRIICKGLFIMEFMEGIRFMRLKMGMGLKECCHGLMMLEALMSIIIMLLTFGNSPQMMLLSLFALKFS